MEITLRNSGKTAALCACSDDCRTRHVIGESCIVEGEGFRIIPSPESKLLHLTGAEIVGILHELEEVIFLVEDEKSSIPPAVLVAIYFDEKLPNNKYAGQLIYASNKNKSENFSIDQNFDFWVVPVKNSIKSAKRLNSVPSILGDHKAFIEVGVTKIYF